MKKDNKLYTVDQIAEKLQVSKKTVYRNIKSGKIKAFKLGQWRISEEDFHNFINQDNNLTNCPCCGKKIN